VNFDSHSTAGNFVNDKAPRDNMPSGTLYVVSTPIGNLEDLSPRAQRILAEVALIACEDTRRTRALLTHLGIRTSLVSYHKDSPRKREEEILQALYAGKDVALVSDAGTPLLQDPGSELVRKAHANGIRVVPIPGPSAALAAWVASGLAEGPFLVYGFLPRRRGERKKILMTLRNFPYPVIIYEAPHRLRAALTDLLEVFGDRPATLARELTKVHEEFRQGSLKELLHWAEETPVRGEITLVVAGIPKDGYQVEDVHDNFGEDFESALAWMQLRIDEGMGAKKAAREAAKQFSLSAREIYQLFHERRREGGVP